MDKLFGTDGIRGVAGVDLTPDLAYRVGAAAVILSGTDRDKPVVLIGRDTRVSGEELESAVIKGALSVGADILRAGILPTPAIAYLIEKLGADTGIVISASHNPVADNGIKVFDRQGFKLSPVEEEAVEILVRSELAVSFAKDAGKITDCREEANRLYSEYLVSLFPLGLRGARVVLDCCYGAAYKIAGDVFRKAGAKVIELNNEPRGDMINVACGSTNPSLAGMTVKKESGYFGLAFDGDADRVIAVDEDGASCDGDYLLAIIATHLKDKGNLKDSSMVGTVMANLGFSRAMEKAGIKVVTAEVGDRFVLAKMRERRLNFGGEQSGHIIFLDHATTGDGILTGLMIASIVAETGRPLRDLKKVMQKMPQVLINVRVGDKTALDSAQGVKAAIKEAEKSLAGKGRILVRPSGTEPLVRVMVEADSQDGAERVANQLADIVRNELG